MVFLLRLQFVRFIFCLASLFEYLYISVFVYVGDFTVPGIFHHHHRQLPPSLFALRVYSSMSWLTIFLYFYYSSRAFRLRTLFVLFWHSHSASIINFSMGIRGQRHPSFARTSGYVYLLRERLGPYWAEKKVNRTHKSKCHLFYWAFPNAIDFFHRAHTPTHTCTQTDNETRAQTKHARSTISPIYISISLSLSCSGNPWSRNSSGQCTWLSRDKKAAPQNERAYVENIGIIIKPWLLR